MRFEIPADRFALAVQAAAHAAQTRGGLELLRGSHWHAEDGRLAVTCTDMQATATARVQADVTEPGSCVVVLPTPGQLKMLKALAGETVTLEASADGTVLTAGSTRCTVKTAPVEDWPTLPELGDPVPLDAAAVASVLASVLPTASGDESRPILCGCLMEVADGGTVTLATTDSFRLRVRTLGPTVLPAGQTVYRADGLAILAKYLKRKGAEVAWAPCDDQRSGFVVTSDGLTVDLTLRHLDGTFPSWRQLIPEAFGTQVLLPRDETLGKIERLQALVGKPQRNTPLRLRLGPDGGLGLKLEQYGEVTAEDAMTVEAAPYRGLPPEPLEVGVSPGFLAGGLDSFTDETVTFGLLDPTRPMLLWSEAHESAQAAKAPHTDCYLVMPIRLAG